MGARGGILSLVLAVGALLVPGSASASGPGAIDLLDRERISPRIVDLTLATPALEDPAKVRVLLPRGYARSERSYPTLYLLHGGNDDYTSWTRQGDGAAERLTRDLPLITVTPTAGLGGWYTDWFNNGLGGPPRWETFHVEQLLPWIDAHFRTRADRSHRAVAGLSMGGFGAMSYAARHPDLFVHAASFSGAVDHNTPPVVGAQLIDSLSQLDGSPPGSLFGPRATQEVRWRAHNPWDLALNLRPLSLSLRTGNGEVGGRYGGGGPSDPGAATEAVVHAMTESLHRRLRALGIAHVNDDYGPGTHDWPYWNQGLRRELPLIMDAFGTPAPRRIDFTAVEPRYEAFGWRVRIRRPALEFSALRGASPRGFRLTGSGRALVTTPRRTFDPRERVRAIVRTEAGRRARVHRADSAGRLRTRVRLGPGNPDQERWTPNGEPIATAVHVARVRFREAGAPRR